MRRNKVIRFQALPRSIRWQAARAGWRDGKAGLPAGLPPADQPLPGADAVALRWDAAIAVLDREYREQLRGILPRLMHSRPQPVAATAQWGPEARRVRTASAAAAQQTAGIDRSIEQVLNLTEITRAQILEVDSVRRHALAVYTNRLLRKHPNGDELSELGWSPVITRLPDWVGRPGPELAHALREHGMAALDQA